MGTVRTMEQERAGAAWQCVVTVKKQNEPLDEKKKWAKEYGQLARSAAADIQANGLGQTLAFWRAKGYKKGEPSKEGQNAHYQILDHVSKWVRQQIAYSGSKELLTWIIEDAPTDGYRRATAEAIAFLTWLKRFAEAELIND